MGFVWSYEQYKLKIYEFEKGKITNKYTCPITNSKWINNFDLDSLRVSSVIDNASLGSFQRINGVIHHKSCLVSIKEIKEKEYSNRYSKQFVNDMKKYYIGYFEAPLPLALNHK